MERRAVSAGDNIDSQCTRCKALLNHTIVAMVGTLVVRVKCNTCGSEHNHRPAKEAKEAREPKAAVTRSTAAKPARATAGRTKTPVLSDEAIWEEAIAPHDPDKAVPYSMNATFRSNTLVSHPTFGIGLVAATQAGKIEVVFKSGRKLLRTA
ncbi:hypothetical protein L4X63_11660 [Geomonas sp. Red32]|uniref:hypothetical protein n=1 Tax=Geomonas sp. Red32 TaxID=2912856 RepID=UPI00202CB711|nr:hypothetical protein [Geomonas sp. Red32]MCM0082246.1 hypothetical protein [Geomonas sp. Red32]